MTATTTDPAVAAALAQLGAADAEPTEAQKVSVTPPADSRLEQLVAQYDMAYAESKKAEQALKAITDGIKSELAKLAPEAQVIDLASDQLRRPLRLQAVKSWRLNTEDFKRDYPLLYVTYAKQSVAWKLAQTGSAIG